MEVKARRGEPFWVLPIEWSFKKKLKLPMWQTKTNFDADCPWDTYPDDLQTVIEQAYRMRKNSIQINIKGISFMVDFKNKIQYRTDDPTRVRNLRRGDVTTYRWFAVNPFPPYDCAPFSDENNEIVETGMSERQIFAGSVCHTIRIGQQIYYIDKVKKLQYPPNFEKSHKSRLLVTVPEPLYQLLPEKRIYGTIPRDSPYFSIIASAFNGTKHSREKNISHENVNVKEIQYHVDRDMYVQFEQQRQRKENDPGYEVKLVFHGTKKENIPMILASNFKMQKIGTAHRNMGWFGCGIYFATRSFTALGYNTSSDELLACLIVVSKTFLCPYPDSAENPYHGKGCEQGYDSHFSPTEKEIVIFNPKMILPCFVLKLSSTDYGVASLSEYAGGSLSGHQKKVEYSIDDPDTVESYSQEIFQKTTSPSSYSPSYNQNLNRQNHQKYTKGQQNDSGDPKCLVQ